MHVRVEISCTSIIFLRGQDFRCSFFVESEDERKVLQFLLIFQGTPIVSSPFSHIKDSSDWLLKSILEFRCSSSSFASCSLNFLTNSSLSFRNWTFQRRTQSSSFTERFPTIQCMLFSSRMTYSHTEPKLQHTQPQGRVEDHTLVDLQYWILINHV